MMNCFGKLTITIFMFSRPAATMPSASTMMPEEKLRKEIKLLYKSDYFSILLTKKMMKKV